MAFVLDIEGAVAAIYATLAPAPIPQSTVATPAGPVGIPLRGQVFTDVHACKDCDQLLPETKRPKARLRCEVCKADWHRRYDRKRRTGTEEPVFNNCTVCDKPLPYVFKKGRQKKCCDECRSERKKQYRVSRKYNKICGHCSKEFQGINERSRFCSKQCQYAELRTRGPDVPRTCDHCGREYLPHSPRAKVKSVRHISRFCSKACKNAHGRPDLRKDRPQTTCKYCGKAFFARSPSYIPTYCSAGCRGDALRKPQSPNFVQKKCTVCHSVFTTTDGRKAFCSQECKKKKDRLYERNYRQSMRLTTPRKYKDRARYFGVAYEPVNITRVFWRDRWTCPGFERSHHV